MKSLGQVFGLFSLLFFGQMAIAIAQPTNEPAQQQHASLVHIKARFVEIPKNTGNIWRNEFFASNVTIHAPISTWQSIADATNYTPIATNAGSLWVSVFVNKNAIARLKHLESQTSVQWLAEPEVTVSSRQATEVRATEIRSLIREKDFQISAPPTVDYPPSLETGSILHLVANVESDGYTIKALVNPTVTDIANGLRLADLVTTNTSRSRTSLLMQNYQATANVTLWDGQTVVIGGLPVPASHVGHRLPPSERELLIFITMNIVDKAGKPVHSDSELPFAQNGIPPQSPQPK